MAEPTSNFKAGLLNLFLTSNLTDFTITCGLRSFKVHKAVISAHSKFFELACQRFKESETGVITLKALSVADEEWPPSKNDMGLEGTDLIRQGQAESAPISTATIDGNVSTTSAPDVDHQDHDDDDDVCDSPAAVESMIDFFYTFDYDIPSEFLIIHARVFAIAVKYHIPDLKDLATQKFRSAVNEHWNLPTFGKAARIAYTTTPEDVKELREIVAGTLLKHDELLDKPEIEDVVRDIPGLSFELLKRKRSSLICSRCAGRTEEGPAWDFGEKKKKKRRNHFRGLDQEFECECGIVLSLNVV